MCPHSFRGCRQKPSLHTQVKSNTGWPLQILSAARWPDNKSKALMDSPAPDTAVPCLWGAPDGFHKAFPWINLRKNKVFLPKAGRECADVFIGKKRMDTMEDHSARIASMIQ